MADKPMVRVLYDYTYTPKDGGPSVSFQRNEEYVLYKKTNAEWWSVYKPGSKPIFVPANYVEVVDKKTKKRVPPKPAPKVPPKPPKPLEPDAVLKDLDDMLDTVIASDPLFDDNDDDASSKDDKSDELSLRASTPDDDGSSCGNLSSKDEKIASSSDSLDIAETHVEQHRKSNGSIGEETNKRKSEIYANSQIFVKPKVQPKSSSLDRNAQPPTGKPLTEVNHNRSSSLGGKETEVKMKKQPIPQPRTTGTTYTEEEPMYANLQELHVKVPPPRPPQPKLPPKDPTTSTGESKIGITITTTDDYSDDDGTPDYANMGEIQAQMTPKNAPPAKPPTGAIPIKHVNAQWAMYDDLSSGRPYYYNATSAESSWRPPVPEVDGKENISANSSLLSSSTLSSVRLHYHCGQTWFYVKSSLSRSGLTMNNIFSSHCLGNQV